MDVLVTGGTGWLGRQVVSELRSRGHRARVLSRRAQPGERDRFVGDLRSGAGIAEAVAGAEAIVHAATGARQPWRLQQVDVKGTRRLLELSQQAGVCHFVYVSIVGIENVTSYPYYRVKRDVEKVVGASGAPFSILRATQFPELIDLLLRGCAAVPGLLMIPSAAQFQVVHTHDVARRLGDVVEGQPAGMLPDFAGPKIQTLGEMAETWQAARGTKRRVVRLPALGRTLRSFAAGKLLAPQHAEGTLTWEDWLRERFGRAG